MKYNKHIPCVKITEGIVRRDPDLSYLELYFHFWAWHTPSHVVTMTADARNLLKTLLWVWLVKVLENKANKRAIFVVMPHNKQPPKKQNLSGLQLASVSHSWVDRSAVAAALFKMWVRLRFGPRFSFWDLGGRSSSSLEHVPLAVSGSSARVIDSACILKPRSDVIMSPRSLYSGQARLLPSWASARQGSSLRCHSGTTGQGRENRETCNQIIRFALRINYHSLSSPYGMWLLPIGMSNRVLRCTSRKATFIWLAYISSVLW